MQYSIETSDHGNADALSRLPVGPDANFDGEEGDADMDTVCTIKPVSLQLNPTDPGTVAKESAKDPIISNVMRYTREGWPTKSATNEDIKAGWVNRGFSETGYISLHSLWLPALWIQSGDSPKSKASGVAASTPGTL